VAYSRTAREVRQRTRPGLTSGLDHVPQLTDTRAQLQRIDIKPTASPGEVAAPSGRGTQ
jgi:hypothetical protein